MPTGKVQNQERGGRTVKSSVLLGKYRGKGLAGPSRSPGEMTGTGPVTRIWTLDSVYSCTSGDVYKEASCDF